MANLNQTPSAERVHIAFFGKRNAGKSSLVNAFTGQSLAIVSDVKGTTTDPVYKAMELLPMGPVMIIDTPGTDDEGELGKLRVEGAMRVLRKTDIAVFVTDAESSQSELLQSELDSLDSDEKALIETIRERKIPIVIAKNKSDLLNSVPEDGDGVIFVSAKTGYGIEKLKETVARLTVDNGAERHIVSDLLSVGDAVVLVTPIDESAPKGRLILPQQQTIRDILDVGASAFVCRDTELTKTLSCLAAPPRMVITDSQAFGRVSKLVPESVPLTSFSILMARYKGSLATSVSGARALDGIKTGDKILIAEGCTHHRQCNDIGSVKLPAWIRKYTNEEPEFTFTSGTEFPDSVDEYSLVVHCGACMLNEREVAHRIRLCERSGVPVTNYGILIAQINGILARSVAPLPEIGK